MDYTVDQLVEHTKHGLGKVVRVEGNKLSVYFKNDKATFKMLASQSPLTPADLQSDSVLDAVTPDKAIPRLARSPRKTVRKPTQEIGSVEQAVERFLKIFPAGFSDSEFIGDDASGERSRKFKAHQQWVASLNQEEFKRLLGDENYDEIAKRASDIEERTDLLHRIERAALWGSVRTLNGGRDFSNALFNLLYGDESAEDRFGRFTKLLDELPHAQVRTVNWPNQTIFPFLAFPAEHLILRPGVTRKAAKLAGFSFTYRSRPNWATYSNLLEFGRFLMKGLVALNPRDMIDIQSFIYVIGDDRYPGAGSHLKADIQPLGE